MVSVHTYPTFELSNAVQLLAKTAPREQKLGPCPETPSVTLECFYVTPSNFDFVAMATKIILQVAKVL